MVNDAMVSFMDKFVKEAANYENVTYEFVKGLEAMAEALKDWDITEEEISEQDLINKMLVRNAE